ncbi:hypothetical protein Y032_0081g1502 [Ancylostoma ceylanicum]|uniref:Uncharacterized protein n=1 Tax=Ancylostoma ceylanicum TaxID=53326 RepID=A0A016TRJ6_9BILA|nr:hypothetical protein Y032_0081g1502 [Ancylostoma ceylanicum]
MQKVADAHIWQETVLDMLVEEDHDAAKVMLEDLRLYPDVEHSLNVEHGSHYAFSFSKNYAVRYVREITRTFEPDRAFECLPFSKHSLQQMYYHACDGNIYNGVDEEPIDQMNRSYPKEKATND